MLSQTAVIVLAAGASRRFGAADKLMAQVQGRPMAAHVLDTVRRLPVAQRIVVVKPDSAVAALADGFDIVVNLRPQDGMGASIAAAMTAVAPRIEAVFIALADMPFVTAEAFHALAACRDADIALPLYGGRQGHPVLFGRPCFGELARLSGDTGARRLITGGRHRLGQVEVAGTGGLIDIDTPAGITGPADSPDGWC